MVVTLVGLILALLSVAVARATIYFQDNSCCANRHFSHYPEYETSNAAYAGANYPVCVQEQVFPNWPSSSGSFFDMYKCQDESVSHPLNGENVDLALCWINSAPSPLLSCAEQP